MSPGKAIAQGGHAFVGTLNAAQNTPEHAAYTTLSPGTKVALQGNLAELGRALDELKKAGIPSYVTVDSGCPDFFGGEPTITALGFGPVTKSKVPKFLRKLGLY